MSDKIIELKGSILTLSVLKIFSDDFSVTQQALKDKVEQAPSFFVGIPVVIEPQVPLLDPTFLALMVEFLHQLQMIPIGIRSEDENIINQAQYAGLAVFPAEENKPEKAGKRQAQTRSEPEKDAAKLDKKEQKTESESQRAAQAPQEVAEAILPQQPQVQSAMVINKAVRSGQQVRAQNRDVIIMGSVNPGAEVLADGNITVFGKVMGKLIAGASGNLDARIFATDLNPEIVCIAGIYQLADDIDSEYKNGLVQVALKNDKLEMIKL